MTDQDLCIFLVQSFVLFIALRIFRIFNDYVCDRFELFLYIVIAYVTTLIVCYNSRFFLSYFANPTYPIAVIVKEDA